MKFGVKYYDEADELSEGSSGDSEVETLFEQAPATKRTPFGDSDSLSDDEFQQQKAEALKRVGRSPGNVDVGLDGKVSETPKARATAEPAKAKPAERQSEQSPATKSNLSKDIIAQLKDGYGITEDEIDFEDEAEAIRFMNRIDRRQSRVMNEEKQLREADAQRKREIEEQKKSPVEQRTIKTGVDDLQREIDRSRGVESETKERPATPEEYQAHLVDKTVGKLKKLGYEPEIIEVFQDLLEHVFFQDKHLREAYSAISGLTSRQINADKERATQESNRFVNIVDTHIGDAKLFGTSEKRTDEQWENLRNVFGIMNEILSRRSDKSVSPALVTRAVSLAFEGNVKTRAEKLRGQSSARMGTSIARTVGRAPGNQEQFKNDRSQHPIVAQKIAEIEKQLRQG